MLLLPESPRFLIRKGRDERAAVSLARLLSTLVDDPTVVLELNDIKANLAMERELELEASGDKTSWWHGYAACFKTDNHIRMRTLTGIFLQGWQQLTGIKYVSRRVGLDCLLIYVTLTSFIFYYGTTFFKRSGISNPFLISVATNVVNVGMTIPGIWTVDRIGRRRLVGLLIPSLFLNVN
jgi:hypothetical protein